MRRVAQVGNSSVIAAQAPDHSLLFYWQNIGSGQWSREQVAGPGTTGLDPQIAQVGNSSVIVTAGGAEPAAAHPALFYWQPIRAGSWNPEELPFPNATRFAPSVAQVGNSSVIAAQIAVDNSLRFYWQDIGSGQWNPEQVAGPGTTFSAPSVAQVGNSSVIAAQGPGESLHFYWQAIRSGNWNPPEEVPLSGAPGRILPPKGNTISLEFPNPSVAQVGNSAVIAVTQSDNSLWFYWQAIGSGNWNPGEQVASGGISSNPSVAQVGNSAVIAATQSNNTLWFYWQAIGSGQWNAEQVPLQGGAAPVTGDPSVAQVGDSSVIAVTRADGSLWFYWQAIGSGQWNAELVAPPGSVLP